MFPWEMDVDGESSGAPGKDDDMVLCPFRLLPVLSEVEGSLLLLNLLSGVLLVRGIAICQSSCSGKNELMLCR